MPRDLEEVKLHLAPYKQSAMPGYIRSKQIDIQPIAIIIKISR